MSDIQIPDTHDVDRYAAHRMAAAAAAKAKRLWPNMIGEVLAGEVMALLDLPSWMRSQTRTQHLIDAILSLPEEAGRSCDDDRPHTANAHCATRNVSASHAA